MEYVIFGIVMLIWWLIPEEEGMSNEQLRLFDPEPPRLVAVEGGRDPDTAGPLRPGDRIGNVVLLEPVERGWRIYDGGGDNAA